MAMPATRAMATRTATAPGMNLPITVDSPLLQHHDAKWQVLRPAAAWQDTRWGICCQSPKGCEARRNRNGPSERRVQAAQIPQQVRTERSTCSPTPLSWPWRRDSKLFHDPRGARLNRHRGELVTAQGGDHMVGGRKRLATGRDGWNPRQREELCLGAGDVDIGFDDAPLFTQVRERHMPIRHASSPGFLSLEEPLLAHRLGSDPTKDE